MPLHLFYTIIKSHEYPRSDIWKAQCIPSVSSCRAVTLAEMPYLTLNIEVCLRMTHGGGGAFLAIPFYSTELSKEMGIQIHCRDLSHFQETASSFEV